MYPTAVKNSMYFRQYPYCNYRTKSINFQNKIIKILFLKYK